MSGGLTVGLLDSGIDPSIAHENWPRRSFSLGEDGTLLENDDGAPDLIGHGSALARIILRAAPDSRLGVARIFHDKFACTPAAAAAGLDWLVDQGARIVNMSFGLREDRAILHEACERAAAAGVVLLGAAPARGPGVYPSLYDGVIRISGDARLDPGEVSVLGGRQADFGACPRPIGGARDGDDPVGGASFAVAHATAICIRFLERNRETSAAALCDHLSTNARFHGPERRTANAKATQP